MRSNFFWYVMLRQWVICCRHFRRTYRPLKLRTLDRPETPESNNALTQRHITEEQNPQLAAAETSELTKQYALSCTHNTDLDHN
jgi:hypothetical protein